MRAVEFAGAFADPQHVRRAVEPSAGQRVLAGQRLLVAEDQCLVRGEHVDLGEVRVRFGVDAAGAHEGERPLDLGGDGLVALPFGAGCHELLGPGVDSRQIGETALGERSQQVQRRRRLVVGLHEALGVGDPRCFRGIEVVDDVATERRQFEIADCSRWARSGAWRTARRCVRPSRWERRRST